MKIELPDYKTVFENQVYARDFETQTHEGAITLRGIVLLKRYTEATENQVVEYLRKKAAQLEGAASLILPEGTVRKDKSGLEKVIVALPDKIIRDIKSGDEECIRFLRGHTSAPNVEHPGQYLHIKYGILPADMVQVNQERGTIQEAAWYNAALEHDELKENKLGKMWTVQLLLPEGNLPEKADIDVMLRHRVHGSKTLEISRVRYDAKHVKGVIDAIYSGLNTTEKISQLEDVSEETLEQLAAQPIIEFHKMIMAAMAAQKAKGQDRGPDEPPRSRLFRG
jgi:hypothetical protein